MIIMIFYYFLKYIYILKLLKSLLKFIYLKFKIEVKIKL